MNTKIREVSNMDNIIDVRAIIARVEELEKKRGDIVDTLEAIELSNLTALLGDLKGNGGDEQWRGDWYPVTLIRDSYFTEYAEELITDCGYIAEDMPGWIVIDWKETAKNVRVDYSSIEFDGITYWYR